MRTKLFTVTVQYGGGHYFLVHTTDNEVEATRVAEQQMKLRMQQWKKKRRGARPSTFVNRCVAFFEGIEEVTA